MSMQTWIDYGYGIMATSIETDVDRLFKLINTAPKFKEKYMKWLKEEYPEIIKSADPIWANLSMDDLFSYCGDNGVDGLAAIITEVFNEIEDFCIYSCVDFNGDTYVIFPLCLPWQLTDVERELTEDKLYNIFKNYVSVLTDEYVDIGNQKCENFG